MMRHNLKHKERKCAFAQGQSIYKTGMEQNS